MKTVIFILREMCKVDFWTNGFAYGMLPVPNRKKSNEPTREKTS